MGKNSIISSKKVRQKYLSSRSINGWFSQEAATLISCIDAYQKDRDIRGDIFEIGVHHGKSSVFMAGLLRPDEQLSVCDIFDDQTRNESVSGKGDEQIFHANMKKVLPAERIRVFKKYSTELTPDEIGNKYRIFHIDGGHNCDEALSDLRLGAKTIVSGGVLVVDDPLRIPWPAVTEAIVLFLGENPNFGAFVLGFNKMCLAERSYVEDYGNLYTDKKTRELAGIGYPYNFKKLRFCGEDLNIFYVHSTVDPDSLKSRAVRYIKARPKLASLFGQ